VAVNPKPPKHLTQGAILRWRRVSGLVLAEAAYEPGQQIHRDAHPNAQFVLVLKGSLTETGAGTAATYGPSTLLFRRADEPLSYRVDDSGARCLIVDMDESWLGRAREQAPLLTRSVAFRRGLLLHLAQRLYGEFRQRDEVSRLAVESLALGVLAEASRREAASRPTVPLWLLVAMTLIEERFREPLSLAAVAKSVGVHPVHLARTFRRVYRTTIGAYVREARIDFARRRLVATAVPIAAIAAEAGFCDQSHFCRHFRRQIGMSPAEYRAAATR
jgi:AraC family transcriptional regulator